jgi:undecaprenyl-diphosphatase
MELIELLKYILLGFIQGITEVLPISSSGHVAIVQEIMNTSFDEGLVFLSLINLGSFLALILYFKKRLKRLVVASWRYIVKEDRDSDIVMDYMYAMKLVVATIPIAIIGLFMAGTIDRIYQMYPFVIVGTGLLVTSTFLFIVREKPKKYVNTTIDFKTAVVVGILQPLSLLPGLSRSGITTSGGLLKKVSLTTALRFSMLLYIPISFGSVLLFGIQFLQNPDPAIYGFDPSNGVQIFYYTASFLMSFGATLLGLRFLFKYFERGKLIYFAVYTMLLGTISLLIGLAKL